MNRRVLCFYSPAWCRAQVLAVFLGGVPLVGCAETRVGYETQSWKLLEQEFEKLLTVPACGESSPGGRVSFVRLQSERSESEFQRSRVDLRAPFRSARAASLALACTEPSSPAYLDRKARADQRWQSLREQLKILSYRITLADRNRDQRALREGYRQLAEMLAEASPAFATELRRLVRKNDVGS